MPAEAIQYVNKEPVILYGGNVDSVLLTCSACAVEYRVHYSNSEIKRIADCRNLAETRINAEHPQHERSILL
jgi:hypothetical protein